MVCKKKGMVTIITLLTIFLGLIIYFSLTCNYSPTQYEQKVIEYFEEVTLNSEYGDNPQKTIKWKSPMYLNVMLNGVSIKQGQCVEQIRTVKNTVEIINSLTDDNFKIILTDDIKKSNSFICFTTRDTMEELHPNFFEGVEENVAGFTKALWKDYYLYKSEIFIDLDQSMDVQKSAIIEEITQSIGLPNDTNFYPNSVFFKDKARRGIYLQEYAKIDKDVIKILYSNKVKAGMDKKQVERAIKKILKNKDISLSGQPY